MITRIVKMTFQEDKQHEFENIFNSARAGIVQFNGCMSVELHQDTTDHSVFFTVSKWTSEEELEIYRSSEFFKATWKLVKPMFAQKAEAWSLRPL